MTSDELARLLAEHAHVLAFEQREDFQRETARQDAERATREQQQRTRKPTAKNKE